MTNEPPQPLRIANRADDKTAPCPFCGSNTNSVASAPFDQERNGRTLVCSRCGAQGPTRWPPTSREPLDLDGARAAWGQRAPGSR